MVASVIFVTSAPRAYRDPHGWQWICLSISNYHHSCTECQDNKLWQDEWTSTSGSNKGTLV